MKKEIKEISCIDNDFNEKTLGLVYLVFIQKIYIWPLFCLLPPGFCLFYIVL